MFPDVAQFAEPANRVDVMRVVQFVQQHTDAVLDDQLINVSDA